jgi:protein SCO1/2
MGAQSSTAACPWRVPAPSPSSPADRLRPEPPHASARDAHTLRRVPQRVRLVLIGVVALAFAGFLGAYLGAGHDHLTENAGAAYEGYVRPPRASVPAFTLTDQDGNRITAAKGLAIYAFIYSHCEDTCPVEVQQIRGALDDLGHDVPVIGVSVDPANDTQASARAFLSKQFMTGRMDFALGTRADLEPIWTAFGIAPQTKGKDHSAGIVIADGARQRIGFPASQLTVEDLAADLRRLGA